MADTIYEVGQRVRVNVGPGRSCRGLILCAGSSEKGDPTYDVLLQSPETATTATAAAEDVDPDGDRGGTEGDRELTGLPPSALSPREPFEVDGTVDRPVPPDLSTDEVSALAEALKGMGNTLFKLGDTDAASEVFSNVLRVLEPPPETGSTVLVRVLTGDAAASVSRYRPGMVSDAEDDGRSYDVIYDETDPNGSGDGVGMGGPDMEEDEEDGVAAERVVTVSLSPCVSCAARLNLARCSFRNGGHAEVVEACTLVMSLAKLTMADKQRPREERAKLRAHCLTALRMRGGSHLAQNHVGLARRDARSMARSAGDDESRAQAARFEGDVERKAKALLKANRKLAKDVTRWVDASMAKHEEASLKDGDGDDPPLPVSPPPGSGRQIKGGSEEVVVSGGGVEECKGPEQRNAASGEGRSWLGSWLR